MSETTHRRDQSAALFARARSVMVGGVNSPVRAFDAVGGQPVFLQRAEGHSVFDADGNRYVDLVGSWGPAIVGHAHPAVVEAVQAAAAQGLSFGACCAAEVELTELIVSALQGMDMIRLVSSGTEACMSAARLARAATGRPGTLKFIGCYHGHADAFLVSAGSGVATLGVPDAHAGSETQYPPTYLAPFNDLATVERIMAHRGNTVAAVFVEPVAGNMGLVMPEPGFLAGLRRLCDLHGVLLVFDEVMTGFRVAWGGYQSVCGVAPDLTCLGKVIGGGLPVSAYGGSRHLMELVSPLGPVYQAGTLSGNPVAMAAGLATLKLCRAEGFYDRLNKTTLRIAEGFRQAAEKAGVAVQVVQAGGMFSLFFSDHPVRDFAAVQACDHRAFARFFHAMLDRGVWLPPSGYEAMFVSSAHDDAAIDHIVRAADEAFRSLGT